MLLVLVCIEFFFVCKKHFSPLTLLGPVSGQNLEGDDLDTAAVDRVDLLAL